MTLRVLLADDQELVRTGFRLILELEPGIEVVAEAADGRQAIARVAQTRPDVVLMDIRMPVLDGIEATRRIASTADAPRVLVLTTFDLDDYVYDAMRAGASGFLLKDAPREQLVAAVRAVARGDTLLAPSVTRRLIERFVRSPAPGSAMSPTIQALSGREQEVLRLLTLGLSNAEIAARLFLGDATVKTHIARLLAKLGVRDRVQAVILAYETGFVRPGEDGAAEENTAQEGMSQKGTSAGSVGQKPA
ncbi:response regulator transcription factor [Microbacterium sp. STN6]|uniref:response regulator transcription factor n=1 Tax=Microbacterium sp. STN6 TaxID=2995588 RepID=UPI002260A9E2|nr:response regulator transcription factor [Microbacterium sp. STN6]MCX7522108.1 response regulator transcription factor [Microbacterium sp. STN6]